MTKIPKEYKGFESFKNELRKKSSALAECIELEKEDPSVGIEASIKMYLPNNTLLFYGYTEYAGDFYLYDLQDEDTW